MHHQERLVQEIVDEHVVRCDLAPIGDQAWAIYGSIAVDGNVIVAEFGNRADAQSLLDQITLAEHRIGSAPKWTAADNRPRAGGGGAAV